MKPSPRAVAIAKKCEDAYSAQRYASWAAVAQLLLNKGLNDLQAEEVMRSKWTRWARDAADIPGQVSSSFRYPARVVGEWLDKTYPGDRLMPAVRELCHEGVVEGSAA